MGEEGELEAVPYINLARLMKQFADVKLVGVHNTRFDVAMSDAMGGRQCTITSTSKDVTVRPPARRRCV